MSAARRLGKYELVAKIGEGGMAEVHLARQRGPRQFEKLVVVKLVHPRLASRPALAEALLDEARLAALVKHPNVVDIYDLGEEGGIYFIAMEYLDGESLATILKTSRAGPRLDPFSTARIIADSAAGLHAAHELKNLKGERLELVHQDVTPGNVIVLYSGQVKLVDFGVAKIRTSHDASLVKGKAGYLAPELFEGASADRRSDVWALGVVLWESLVLRRLFAARTEEETFARIRAGDIQPPSKLSLGITSDLDDVCLKALARDPAARYQTAKAMHDDLVAVLRAANWTADSEPIARFMRSVFAPQISARQELLRELAAREEPRPEVLEQLHGQGGGDDGLVLDEVVAVAPPAGAARPPTHGDTPAGDGEVDLLDHSAVQLVEPPQPRRRLAMVAAAAAALLVTVVVAATQRGDSSSSGPAAAARTGRAPAVAAPTVDAGVAGASPGELAAASAPDAGAGDDRGDGARGEAPPGEGSEAAATTEDVARPGTGATARRDREPRDRRRDPGPASASPVVDERMPTTAHGLYKDGLGRYVAGDTGGAIARFRAALDRDPRYAPAHRGLGMAYERKGDRGSAARSYQRYLQLAPGASDAAQIRGRLENLR